MKTLLAAICFVLLVDPPVSSRDKHQIFINETVFLRPGAEARVDQHAVDVNTIPLPASVEKRDGEWLWVGTAWVREKDLMKPREAVEYYTEQTRIKPEDAILWRNLGAAWQNARVVEGTDRALKCFAEALRLDPNDAWTYSVRAEIWSYQQKYEDAIRDITEALRLKPKEAELYSKRGDIRMRSRQFAAAIEDYDRAIELAPTRSAFYDDRANVRQWVGDLDGEISDYLVVMRLCEGDPAEEHRYSHAFNIVASIYATWPEDQYRDGEKALRIAKKAYEISSADTKPRGFEEPDVLEIVAHAAAEAGDFDEAINWTRQALKWWQKDPYEGPESQSWRETKAYYTARIEQFKQKKPYRDPKRCDEIAWAKATCPTEKYRDGKRALELATKACELSEWKKQSYLVTLAAAYAATGNFDKAIEWEQKAKDMIVDDEPDANPKSPDSPVSYRQPAAELRAESEARLNKYRDKQTICE